MSTADLARIWRDECAEDELLAVVLYRFPPDYPEDYVLRAQYASTRGIRQAVRVLAFKFEPSARDWMKRNMPELSAFAADNDLIVASWV